MFLYFLLKLPHRFRKCVTTDNICLNKGSFARQSNMSLLNILIFVIHTTAQLNLYYTDHDCLRLIVYFGEEKNEYQKLEYCFDGILPMDIAIDARSIHSHWTFDQLSRKNITGEQLYHWSALIDLIERYEFYLDQPSATLGEEIFYNCTGRRFGQFCQYGLIFDYMPEFSLEKYLREFQMIFRFESMSFTCYIHLVCHRGEGSVCLDWSEICDGKIDCFNDGIDEKNCWQLEVNQCNQEDEYRCINGHCIPKSFDHDQSFITDCLDGSDENMPYLRVPGLCNRYEQPNLGCDDITCKYTHLTSSCTRGRDQWLVKSMYLTRGENISEECWLAWKCLIESTDQQVKQNVQTLCPRYLTFPSTPGLRDGIYFIYQTDQLPDLTTFPPPLFHLCYNQSSYHNAFINHTKIFLNGMTCISSEDYHPSHYIGWKYEYDNIIYQLFKDLKRFHFPYEFTWKMCHRLNMYQCLNSSKCISIYRLKDSNFDCPLMDDENVYLINNTNLMTRVNSTRFYCQSTGEFIHLALRNNLICDCETKDFQGCEDEELEYIQKIDQISFPIICDGVVDLDIQVIEGRNETDETECQSWPCNHLYTHCDDLWNCPHGVDETGCLSYGNVSCSTQEHLCISMITNRLICLPWEQANDDHVDCLGGTDEPEQCEEIIHAYHGYGFGCIRQNTSLCISKKSVCDDRIHCDHGDDEQICTQNQSDAKNFLDHQMSIRLKNRKYFAFQVLTEIFTTPKVILPPTIHVTDHSQPRCHRGLDVGVRWNDEENSFAVVCLCPPSYYGDQCQYQNQRVSVAIRFRALSNSWQTIFAIGILLIDQSNERMVHSFEQLTYLAMRDCKVKFNIYLLYATRPKNLSESYAIHIDIYEKVSLTYRASFLYPISFNFLPVHRLALMIDIPTRMNDLRKCSQDRCVHGKCFHYAKYQKNQSFCQCDHGWSGQYCTIPHTCTCSSDSLCLGVTAKNQSICVCPLNKWGPRCLMRRTVCQIDDHPTCENGGQCVANDDLMSDRKFVCICRKGYRGERCELMDNQVILSFTDEITFSQSIFLHFIEVIDMHNAPVRATTFKTIPVRQDSVVVHWSRPFHLVFIELVDKTYYLAVLQTIYNGSTMIRKTIDASDRCPHIREVLNRTITQWSLIRRIKYYHIPCQIFAPNLKCFYDDVHLCLCYDFGQQRLANCLNFDHNMTFDCLGQSECENGAQCLQDHPECPTSSLCMCPPCFYGRRCQFRSSGFGLSLDAILGYHILPKVNFNEQPLIIKMSLTGTVIFLVIGLINSVLSLMTFKNKHVREVGCGLYLLGSSMTALLIMITFGSKFIILILTQMTIITNRSFLSFQCHSIDFLLRICLCMDQWLSACVAIERAITAIKGTRFDKKKSKQTAKLVIMMLLIVVTSTAIHDPIYRRLIDERNNDDDNLQRIWCTVSYSSALQVYNNIIHSCHFCGAFIINLVSVVILIKMKSRQNAAIHPQLTHRDRLQGQFRQHKHLLTAPIVLVILALPRLIISFVSKCMQSANDSWLFLVGYFVSLIPPMLTFVVFVLPSKFYRKEFHKSVQRFRRRLYNNICI